MKFGLGILLILISSVVYADSCVIPDEQAKTLSRQYEHLVTISTASFNGNVLIKISTPLEVGGHSLRDLFLVKGAIDSPELIVPIKWQEEQGIANAWYSANETIAKANTVVLSFGKCGIELRYPVSNSGT